MWNSGLTIRLIVALVALSTWGEAAEPSKQVDATKASEQKIYTAADSLDITKDQSADANVCLDGLCWEPTEFVVTCRDPLSTHGDRLVQFPSAVSSGDAENDVVSMEWYLYRNKEGEVQQAPAIVVVHESGSNMNVGRIFASSLRHLGFHTFMIQLPYYGHRRTKSRASDEANQFKAMRQGVADVRRARDAVAVIPEVDSQTIALQGTSLGGFVSATAASLDGKYDGVFLLLAGGDLYDIVQNGAKDAAKARERLAKQGLVGEKLLAVTQVVEPTRVAHRMNPKTAWLYSGLYDTVVPMKNALLLATSISLDDSHHIKMPANHYSGVVFLPMIFSHIQTQMNALHKAAKSEGR